jgi:hypothetical protein
MTNCPFLHNFRPSPFYPSRCNKRTHGGQDSPNPCETRHLKSYTQDLGEFCVLHQCVESGQCKVLVLTAVQKVQRQILCTLHGRTKDRERQPFHHASRLQSCNLHQLLQALGVNKVVSLDLRQPWSPWLTCHEGARPAQAAQTVTMETNPLL